MRSITNGHVAIPVISLLPASIICITFFIIQFFAIYAFKHFYVPEFKQARIEDRLVHVLANTLVVIPYMTWDQVKPEKDEIYSEERIRLKRKVIQQRRASLIDISLTKESSKSTFKKGHKRNVSAFPALGTMTSTGQDLDEIMVCESAAKKVHDQACGPGLETSPAQDETFVKPKVSKKVSKKLEKLNMNGKAFNEEEIIALLGTLPDLNKVAGSNQLFEEILKIWWKNPKENLTVDSIVEEVHKSPVKHFLVENREQVQEVVDKMIEQGYINKSMFNPRRTKMEYFWLFAIQFGLNMLALIVEVANGGVKTRSGLYYSWDVRIASFVLGIIFLSLYYRRYHVLKNLTRFEFCGCGLKFCPIFFCCKKDEPMQAIPDEIEMNRCLSENLPKHTMQTQTSVIIDKKPDSGENPEKSGDNPKSGNLTEIEEKLTENNEDKCKTS